MTKGDPKTASKKVPRQTQTLTYSNARGLPESQPRVRTVRTSNSCSSSIWSTVRDSWRKKWTGLKFGVKNWLDGWIVANNTEWVAENCWLSKTKGKCWNGQCWNNCWSKWTKPLIWYALGQGPANSPVLSFWCLLLGLFTKDFLCLRWDHIPVCSSVGSGEDSGGPPPYVGSRLGVWLH